MILGKKISSIEIRYPKMIKTDLGRVSEGSAWSSNWPWGVVENICFSTLTDKVLISHLRMEGKYFYYPDKVPERKHAHVFIHFEDGGTLVYEDVRKFGTMETM